MFVGSDAAFEARSVKVRSTLRTWLAEVIGRSVSLLEKTHQKNAPDILK